MISAPEPNSTRFAGVRAVLDALATLAALVTMFTLLWSMRHTTSPASTRPPVPLPATPISLEGAPVLGSLEAGVVLIEFSDFQCPYCALFSRRVLPELKRKYIDPGRVLLAFRHFPLSTIHPRARRLAEAAECASRQMKFWAFHDQLFGLSNSAVTNGTRTSNFQSVEELDLQSYAEAAGLSTAVFGQCLAGDAVDHVRRDGELAAKLKLSSTPSFLIGERQSNGQVRIQEILVGALPLSAFDAGLTRVLKDSVTEAR